MKRRFKPAFKSTRNNTPKTATVTGNFSPERSAAIVIHRFAGLDTEAVAQGQAVAGGNLDTVRRSLAAQITTVERMFLHFFELACQHDSGEDAHDRLMRLSLRAQTQSTRAAAVLGRLTLSSPASANQKQEDKNHPPVVEDAAAPAWMPPMCGPECPAQAALVRLTRIMTGESVAPPVVSAPACHGNPPNPACTHENTRTGF